MASDPAVVGEALGVAMAAASFFAGLAGAAGLRSILRRVITSYSIHYTKLYDRAITPSSTTPRAASKYGEPSGTSGTGLRPREA